MIDNLLGKLYLVVYADPREPGAYARARRRLAELLARLRQPVAIPASDPCPSGPTACEFARGCLHRGGRAGQALHLRGRHHAGGALPAHAPARSSLAPSPCTGRSADESLALHVLLRLDTSTWWGPRPEILVRLEGEPVTVRPIAGTRPRGRRRTRTPARGGAARRPQGARRARDAHGPGPQRRGRVAATGRVRVTENMVIERYSHVMHIVSNVGGRLRPALGALDVLEATFPPGTVTGAPRCAPWRSSTSWSPSGAASTPAPWATWASTATWISPSPSGRRW
ncbi:MAG: hypothetical protein KatS3mg123_1539 [Burkholderiales bacterium]|nr:MAG: hypothetical protein KatS3mg123_1539 [Burkholderiales bacterium]